MRRIIFTVLSLMMFAGVASADRPWRRDTSHRSGGTVVRDHRQHDTRTYDRGRDYRRYDNRRDYRRYDYSRDRNYRDRVRFERRPIYVNNGRFHFHGGITRTYSRPVIQYRYYDYRYRPQILVENYDPVPGYIWVQGSWSWNGYEWIWVGGHYAPDPNNWDNYYYYDQQY